MKRYTAVIACIFSSVLPVSGKKNAENEFRELYSLEGIWIMKTKKGAIGEEWHKVNDNYLQSRGFFIKEKDTVTSERVALRNTKEGIFYTSTVEDQNNGQSVDFKLTSAVIQTKTFVFENPQHDFPKRIVYEIVSADSLHAYIDGGVNDPGKRQDFYYHKERK